MIKKVTEAIISVLLISLFTAGLLSLSTFGQGGSNTLPDEDDIFEKLEKTLDCEGAEQDYQGFIFSVSDDLSLEAQSSLAGKIASGEITSLKYADNVFVADSLEAIRESLDGSDIVSLEPDYLLELFGEVPDDPEYSSQYDLEVMNVPAVWDMGYEGQDVDGKADDIVIAVIDSGLMTGHEDMDYSRVIPGRDFTGYTVSFDTEDSQDHGTFVCGLLAAVKNNSKGIAGILQKVKLLPLKAFGGKKTGTSNVIDAINYAVEEKTLYDESEGKNGTNICVINMSFGGRADSSNAGSRLKSACEAAINAGIILVCAAGNNADGSECYPAQYSMGVASVDREGQIAENSSHLSQDNGSGYQNKVWVAAPGENLRSLATYSLSLEEDKREITVTKSGTSFSCPEVSALAAICKSIDNDMTQSEFMQLLKETSHYIDSDKDPEDHSGDINGQDIRYGWGIIDYQAAVTRLLKDQKDALNDETDPVRIPESTNVSQQTEPVKNETPAEPEKRPSSSLFPDVSDPSSPVYKPVYWAVEKGIVRGYSNGQFGPEDSCSREQFVVMLWRLAGRPQAFGNVEFSDADISRSTYRALQWAVEEDIIRGFSDGTFRPQEAVSREQAVIMLWRMAGRAEAEEQADFTDITSSFSGFAAISWGSQTALIKGFPDGSFRPLQHCLRQEMVIFLYRFSRIM